MHSVWLKIYLSCKTTKKNSYTNKNIWNNIKNHTFVKKVNQKHKLFKYHIILKAMYNVAKFFINYLEKKKPESI